MRIVARKHLLQHVLHVQKCAYATRVAVTFTGQGSQFVGMGDDIFNNYNQDVQKIVDDLQLHVKHAKLESVLHLMHKSHDTTANEEEQLKDLTRTSNAQPAILLHSTALFKIFQSKMPSSISFDVCLGHSLGEYSALVASNAISIETALHLVRRRGLLMEEACFDKPTEMAALMPCAFELAQKVLHECSSSLSHDMIVNIANVNSSQQVVISGHKEAVVKAIEVAKKFGVKRSILLNVSAPFHSQILQPVSRGLAQDIQEALLQQETQLEIPIISNVTASIITRKQDMIPLLQEQIYKPVMWYQSMLTCCQLLRDKKKQESDKSVVLEIGPKSVLLPLMKRMDHLIQPDYTFYIGNLQQIEQVIREVNKI